MKKVSTTDKHQRRTHFHPLNWPQLGATNLFSLYHRSVRLYYHKVTIQYYIVSPRCKQTFTVQLWYYKIQIRRRAGIANVRTWRKIGRCSMDTFERLMRKNKNQLENIITGIQRTAASASPKPRAKFTRVRKSKLRTPVARVVITST